jgi:phosphatidyl-myo-inositol dimannoside synthase
MRLLILTSEFPPGPGGIGTHAYQLAHNLCATGWEVTVITPQDYAAEGEIMAFSLRQSFEIVRLRAVPGAPLELLYRWLVTTRLVRSSKPDVILATGSRQVWLAALLSKIHKIRWLAVGHGSEFDFGSAWQRRLTRWAFQQASAVVCVSRFTWRYMEKLNIVPHYGEVIPNGADATRFKRLDTVKLAEFRQQNQLPDGKLLVTVGNVTERKGQDVVIRALPNILAQIPDVHYLIVGLPTYKDQFRALARELSVGDHVHFLGRVDAEELVVYLNLCELFVMTSKHTTDGDFEGYGIAVIEAALCGKPAVVSAGSGLAEAVIDGETGFTVPQGDSNATAEAILALLKDDTRRAAMGQAAFDRAVDGQTWEQVAYKYHAVLQKIVQQKSTSASDGMETSAT